jgi:hypothetical protein
MVVTGPRVEWSSFRRGLFNEAFRDSKEFGRFRFWGHILNHAHDPRR